MLWSWALGRDRTVHVTPLLAGNITRILNYTSTMDTGSTTDWQDRGQPVPKEWKVWTLSILNGGVRELLRGQELMWMSFPHHIYLNWFHSFLPQFCFQLPHPEMANTLQKLTLDNWTTCFFSQHQCQILTPALLLWGTVADVQGLASQFLGGRENSAAESGYILSITCFIYSCTPVLESEVIKQHAGSPLIQISHPTTSAWFSESNSVWRIGSYQSPLERANSLAVHTVSSLETAPTQNVV